MATKSQILEQKIHEKKREIRNLKTDAFKYFSYSYACVERQSPLKGKKPSFSRLTDVSWAAVDGTTSEFWEELMGRELQKIKIANSQLVVLQNKLALLVNERKPSLLARAFSLFSCRSKRPLVSSSGNTVSKKSDPSKRSVTAEVKTASYAVDSAHAELHNSGAVFIRNKETSDNENKFREFSMVDDNLPPPLH